MTFKIKELPRAQDDIRHIFYWIFERSPQGASAWLTAYEDMLKRLEKDATIFGRALENEDCEFEIQEILFRTRRGRPYRAIYFINEDVVNIVRVRGPGQAPTSTEEL